MRQEIEAPSTGIFHRQGNFPALVRKPSDLVIESIQGRIIGVCKNRPRNRVQINRDGQSRGSESIPRRIPLPVEVKISKGYEVFFGCLSFASLSFCSCFLEICFLLLSLFFLPPLSPIARSFHIVSLYPPCVASSRCEFAFCLSSKSKYHRFSVLAIRRMKSLASSAFRQSVNIPSDRSISISIASLDFYPLDCQYRQCKAVGFYVINTVWLLRHGRIISSRTEWDFICRSPSRFTIWA